MFLSAATIILVSTIALHTPIYEFRGYNNMSSCTEIRDVEISRGGRVTEIGEKSKTGFRLIKLESVVFGFNAEISIRCDADGSPTNIGYVTRYDQDIDLYDVFESYELAAVDAFGQADVTEDQLGQAATYMCKDGVLIQLILEVSNAIRAVALYISAHNKRCE